ncbi:MAG: DUF433 domain-containing protein [Euryarchaeota archaeon]|jgi:uncharacterized protein (DUF433 family)|nr:DUF433 domain-containing protein [Euryarchaeota archaeon]
MSVETKTEIRGGEPVLSETRVPVLDIADVYLASDEDAHATAATFRGITLSDVHEALAYYYAQPKEMRHWIAERNLPDELAPPSQPLP